MNMIKISINNELTNTEDAINELMDLHLSCGSFKKINDELIENKSIDELLDAYEFETNTFYFEVLNVKNLRLENLQIEKINKV